MERTNISTSMKTQTSLSLPLVTVEIKATLLCLYAKTMTVQPHQTASGQFTSQCKSVQTISLTT